MELATHSANQERRFARPPAFDTPRAVAGRKLGKAVHPAALDRLFEIDPNAQVRVRHHQYHYRYGRYTTVVIETEDGMLSNGLAICHPDDNWDRRRGVQLAFTRALKAVPR